ncbi:MDR family MFS transporter [Bacillus amyloliquefaciens]|uniref:MDR family MFS transporter n=1 Tax=Bacillus amyloliquefaciens TaxID=1390 RepID=UPI001580C84D|nr:MDR family MFS transporter [Bacillus amyloliquefaciens]NUI24269.1 multidrug efflux MFS transporter [Bacillus amyloliquefaciens]NUI33256.1 multidrug efflux MFS transporter [Bacillus amyloliquefaciens]NUI36962.1 multidrug efflux MFS transporter [Bacillus amyloliquefaciens]NUI70798.1 multidrug efflux MFS transporter [Bacillus amyloliquefaciens]NUI74546.1 multidrug efflux MFS transporter [Bacillus amyloliquefaciens]
MNKSIETAPYNRSVIVGILLAGAFVAILNQTLLITALPHIMNDFNIDANKAQWLTTSFMLTNGILIPITAFLIEKFTSRTLLISAMSIFTAGTIVGAFAPNFPVLLTARIIQAAGAGIMLPLMQTVFLTIFPMEKRGRAMGMVGLVISFAPAIGPTLSGWAVEAFSWRSLFYIIFPIAVIDLLLAIILMKNVTTLRETQIDILSVILSTLGFGGLLYGFSSAGSSGWTSAEVLTSLLVGAAALIFFIARQMKLKKPMLEFRVFSFGIFSLTTLLGTLVFALLIGTETILPLYTQKVRGVSAFDTGLMLLPGAIVMGMMSPFIGRVFDRIGGKGLSMTGFFIILLTSLPFMNLTNSTSLIWIVVVYTARLLGTAMIMMPVTTAGINALPRHLIPHGTAMNNTVRQVGGSIGTALLVSVMSSQAAHANASTPGNAALHGMNAAFVVAACIALAGFLLSFTLKKKPRQPEQQQAVTR